MCDQKVYNKTNDFFIKISIYHICKIQVTGGLKVKNVKKIDNKMFFLKHKYFRITFIRSQDNTYKVAIDKVQKRTFI